MSLPRGVGQTITFPMCDDTRTLLSGLVLRATVQQDGGAPAASTNAATEIGTTCQYRLTLTGAERNAADVVVVATDGYFSTVITDSPDDDAPTVRTEMDANSTKLARLQADITATPAGVGAAMTLAANQDVGNVGGTLPDVNLAASQTHIVPAQAGAKMDLVDAPNATALGALWNYATAMTGGIGKRSEE